MADKISDEINNLSRMTIEGKIDWILQQPNAFNSVKWERSVDGKSYTTIVQKQPLQGNAVRTTAGVIQTTLNSFYFFTIIKNTPAPQDVLLQLNTQLEVQYKSALEELFNVALERAKASASEILNNLLKGL